MIMLSITCYIHMKKEILRNRENAATKWSMPCFDDNLLDFTAVRISNGWKAFRINKL